MSNFEIHYLADKPEHIEACAAWIYGRWGVQNPAGSFSRALDRMEAGAQKEKLPLAIVATHKKTGLPVAMANLWTQDGDEWADRTPWIASVFTHYRYRGQGIARQLVERLEKEATRLGFKEIYLKSGSAAGFYPQLGYSELDKKPADTAAGSETLFRKELT